MMYDSRKRMGRAGRVRSGVYVRRRALRRTEPAHVSVCVCVSAHAHVPMCPHHVFPHRDGCSLWFRRAVALSLSLRCVRLFSRYTRDEQLDEVSWSVADGINRTLSACQQGGLFSDRST